MESAFQLLDAERREVVRTFKAIMTPEMHAYWEIVNECRTTPTA